MQALFGELRDLLEQVPSVNAFETIVFFIDYHARDEEQRAQIEAEWIPYALGKLQESWPDRTRECPRSLLEGYEANTVVWAPLVASVNFEAESMSAKRLKQLVAAEHMKCVTGLNLCGARSKWEQLEELSTHSPFGDLKYLAFRRAIKPADYDSLATFFGSKMLSSVTHLSFKEWDKIKPDVYTLLEQSFPLENLTCFDFTGPRVISPRSLKALLGSGRLTGLEELYFERHDLSKDYKGVLKVLAGDTGLKNLKRLHLTGADSKDIQAFVKATHFESLEVLKLHTEGWDVKSMQVFAKSSGFPSLKRFVLMIRQDQSEVLQALASSELLQQLTSLEVRVIHNDAEHFESYAEHARAFISALDGASLQRLKWCEDINKMSREDGFEQGDLYRVTRSLLEGFSALNLESLRGFAYEQIATYQTLKDYRVAHQLEGGGSAAVLTQASWFHALDEFLLKGEMFGDEDVKAIQASDVRCKYLGLEVECSLAQLKAFVDAGKLDDVRQLRFFSFAFSASEFENYIIEIATKLRLRGVRVPHNYSVYLERSEKMCAMGVWVWGQREFVFTDTYASWLSEPLGF